MSFKGYEFRIYPNDTQIVMINKTIGCVRKVWNLMLNDNNKSYELTNKGKLNSPASYKSEYPYLKEVDSDALSCEWMNLKQSFGRFFSHQNDRPLFKCKRGKRQSFTSINREGSIRFEHGKLRLPKIGFIPIRLHRNVEGGIKSVTIKRAPTNKYYAVILTEQKSKTTESSVPTNKSILGIDMSMNGFGVTNEGITFAPPKWFNRAQHNLKIKQQQFSRTRKDSIRHEKTRIKVANIHETIANQRKDWLHKLSTKLANEYDVIVLEDINLQHMSRLFGKSISQNGFGMFRTMLEYKMKDRLKEVYKVNKFFASSQLCNHCGSKNQAIKGLCNLGVRDWICTTCGTHHNRDINAAKNLVKYYLEKEGQNISATLKTDIKQKARGDCVRPSSKRITKIVRRRKAIINEPRKIENRTLVITSNLN